MSVSTDNIHLFIPSVTSISEKLADVAAKIAFANFQWRYVTLVLFNTTMFNAENFFVLYDKSVVINTGMMQPSDAEHTDQFVVFGRDVQDITHMLDWLKSWQFDNTGRYIIICDSDAQHNCDETEAVNAFWYHKIVNVIFIKRSRDKVSGYIYFYSEKNCAMSEPVEMANFEFCINNVLESGCSLYPEKFSNFHRCPLIASTFEQPPYMTIINGAPAGSDGDLLLILAKAMNCTLQMMTPYWGDGWGAIDPKTNKWYGSLADLYYDKANISMTSAALTLNRFSDFQISYNYNFVKIGWITSPTELEPSSLKLLHPFGIFIHIAVDIVFLFAVVTALFVRSNLWTKLMRKPDADSQTIVLNSWMICMGLPTIRLPQKSFFLQMTFLWIWYTFLVRTMYQAALINSLKNNKYLTNVDTIEQAIDANYKIGGGHALRDYYLNYPLVYDRFIGMNATVLTDLVYQISRGEKFAVAVNLDSVNTFLKRHPGENLHVVPQRILVSPTAIFFKKFSPMAVHINLLLQRLFEAGIPDKLYRKYLNDRPKRSEQVTENEPLRLEHYKGCYAVLALGWAASTIAFFLEKWFRFRNKLI